MAPSESCGNCVYSYWDRRRAIWALWAAPIRPACANHPDSFGRMQECPPGQVCPNFRPRPPTPTGQQVKMIPLGDRFYTYVDAADFPWLSQWTWYLCNGYAARREKNRVIFMHREIMQAPKGMEVDHQNRNKLDNTRENLRVCTRAENAQNRRKPRNTSSRFWGVSYIKDRARYMAFVCYKGEVVGCGCFTEELAAARTRDYKAVELLGELARLNFPEEWPPARRKRVRTQYLRAQARPKPKHPPKKPKRSPRSAPKTRKRRTEDRRRRTVGQKRASR